MDQANATHEHTAGPLLTLKTHQNRIRRQRGRALGAVFAGS